MNFPQFAFNNVRRNSRAYFAYFVSSAFMVMIFFTYAVFIYHPDITQTPMGNMTRTGMQFAEYIIFIFSFLFVFYSISVFLKARNKELGILTMLGATNGQLNRLIFVENMFIGSASIVVGVLSGLILSKMFLLLSTKAVGIEGMRFYWPLYPALLTAGVFLLLFLIISLFTLLFIRSHRVIELLKGSSSAKPEPKASIGISLLCVALLATGLLSLQRGGLSPLVLLVAAVTGIAGTYFFYTQLSVLTIRLLKRSRRLLWRKTRLIWISEMAYKIKDNARMLFMVTVVTSIACMSVGFVLSIDAQNKKVFSRSPFAFKYYNYNEQFAERDLQEIDRQLLAIGVPYSKFTTQSFFSPVEGMPGFSPETMSRSTYEQIAASISLPQSEKLAVDAAFLVNPVEAYRDRLTKGATVTLKQTGTVLNVTGVLQTDKLPSSNGSNTLLVVADDTFQSMAAKQQENNRKVSSKVLYLVPAWPADRALQPDDPELLLSKKLNEWNQESKNLKQTDNYLSSRAQDYLMIKQATSLFSFIGVFIAAIFSIASASFLYFKLHTDLNQDSTMYHMLSKTGMSIREMKHAATVQIAMLFFIPTIISTIQTVVVLRPILHGMGLTPEYGPVLTASAFFAAAQVVYFLLVRSRYLLHLKKVMV
ncbi:FtsX-like permease family protein [Paenibacillus rigui]|uniref:ABC transporter permease n=1 Tax=Paenibacillus rigui TaxID=554312 RepID=A0A229UHP4_9BACL|nr:FtsX-like permease family protein [Paenibacillus rigui]OXM82947.1 ABC transporter permease [Paenibacillus rigui]